MTQLIFRLLAWLVRHALSVLLVLIVLVVGKWVVDQFRLASEAQSKLEAIETRQDVLNNALLNASTRIDQEISRLAGNGAVTDKVKLELEALIKEKSLRRDECFDLRSTVLPSVANFQCRAVLELEIAALNKALSAAVKILDAQRDIANHQQAWRELSESHQNMRSRWFENQLRLTSICDQHPLKCKVFITTEYRQVQELIQTNKDLVASLENLRLRIENIKLMTDIMGKGAGVIGPAFADPKAGINAATQWIAEQKTRQKETFFGALLRDFWPAAKAQLFTALLIVLMAIAFPIVIKLVYYYLIAPLASRQPAIRILDRSSDSENFTATPSLMKTDGGAAGTLKIHIAPHEELMVHPAFLQSTSTYSSKSTKWLLNEGLPFACIAAGLYELTRVTTTVGDRIDIGPTHTKEALTKIVCVEIPDQVAVVFQPRALVGVVQDKSRPLRITSHWRLWHLHSWLTLQFRYLVFHGQVKLLVKGCQGVRIENADQGRLVNQASTLGFSADAEYSVQRCETFLAYLRGADDLFNDRFNGNNCVYFCEELPGRDRRGHFIGRGFEGVSDSVFKAFGI